jgi:hypothetical protein
MNLNPINYYNPIITTDQNLTSSTDKTDGRKTTSLKMTFLYKGLCFRSIFIKYHCEWRDVIRNIKILFYFFIINNWIIYFIKYNNQCNNHLARETFEKLYLNSKYLCMQWVLCTFFFFYEVRLVYSRINAVIVIN